MFPFNINNCLLNVKLKKNIYVYFSSLCVAPSWVLLIDYMLCVSPFCCSDNKITCCHQSSSETVPSSSSTMSSLENILKLTSKNNPFLSGNAAFSSGTQMPSSANPIAHTSVANANNSSPAHTRDRNAFHVPPPSEAVSLPLLKGVPFEHFYISVCFE